MSAVQDENCSCSREPITVVLLGCTQHGKSSLIRSLYDYAGRGQAGDAVKVGSHGNASTTKDCSAHHLTVELREHVLKEKDGRILSVESEEDVEDAEMLMDEYMPDNDDDEVGPPVVHEIKQTGQHFHLRIIDTPGLDDSDNAKAAGRVGLNSHVNAVDERHKMSIFRAVAREGRLSSVCFVVSTEENLGANLPRMLRQYKELFTAMGVGFKVYFLHTRVNQYDMWNKMTARPLAVKTTLGDWNAEHHFINNLPDGLVGEYLSQTSLAGFLASLSQDGPQAVQQGGYPKSQAYKVIEQPIVDALRAALELWEGKTRSQQREIEWTEIKRQGLEARHRKQMEIWRNIDQEFRRLDTCEEIEIWHFHGHAGHFIFWPARIHVNLNTDHPIRNIKKDTPGHAHWEGAPDDHWRGKRQFSQFLVANGPFSRIWTQVWLYGWRKDMEASRLDALRRERDEAWAEQERTKDEMDRVCGQVARARRAMEALERRRDGTAARIAALQREQIPLDVVESRGHYIASASPISYAYGLGATQDLVALSLLPTAFDGAARAAAMARYRAKKDELEKDAEEVAAYKAAEAMVRVVLARDVRRPGAFASLTMAIEKFGPESQDVWDCVFYELKECYSKDPQNWEKFLEVL